MKNIRSIGIGVVIISIFFKYIFFINRKSNIIFNYTSRVSYPENIKINGDMKSKNALNSFLASNSCYFQAKNGIEIDCSVLIGPGVKIISANHSKQNLNYFDKTNPIKICKNVWIGSSVVILPGVSIGENTIIGAGSVVTKSIPSNCIAIGNPCRVIKKNN